MIFKIFSNQGNNTRKFSCFTNSSQNSFLFNRAWFHIDEGSARIKVRRYLTFKRIIKNRIISSNENKFLLSPFKANQYRPKRKLMPKENLILAKRESSSEARSGKQGGRRLVALCTCHLFLLEIQNAEYKIQHLEIYKYKV